MLDHARAELIESQLGTVKNIAGHMSRRIYGRIDYEELVSVGYLALVECIGSFDGLRGASLKTFVSRRIYGAMLDFMRAEDPLTRDHRKEVGGSFQASHQFADEGDDTSGTKISALVSYFIDPEAHAVRTECLDFLERYPTKQHYRDVMRMSFVGEKSQIEIARELGISHGRVSQIISTETLKLRTHLGV